MKAKDIWGIKEDIKLIIIIFSNKPELKFFCSR